MNNYRIFARVQFWNKLCRLFNFTNLISVLNIKKNSHYVGPSFCSGSGFLTKSGSVHYKSTTQSARCDARRGLAAVRDGVFACFVRQVRLTLCDMCAQNTEPGDVHSQLCEVYGEKYMSIPHVPKWCSSKKDVQVSMTNSGPEGHRFPTK